MDKNSLIGMLLLGGIILAYLTYISPSEEEMERTRITRDSLEQVEIKNNQQAKVNNIQVSSDTLNTNNELPKIAEEGVQVDQFETSDVVENKYYTIENDLIKVTISSLGGRISSVELKNFKTYDTLPLILFDEQHSKFGLKFFVDNKRISTNELQFKTNGASFEVGENDSKSLSMRYYASGSEYVEYKYTLEGNSYEVGTDINLVGINNLVASNIVDMDLDWEVTIFPLEKNAKDERSRYSTIYYKYAGDDVDYISEGSDDDITGDTKMKWIAYKQQFFSSILTAETAFQKPINLTTKAHEDSLKVLKTMSTSLAIPFNHNNVESFPVSFYFGPIDYDILSAMDDDYEELVQLGPSFIDWVSKWFLIPLFNVLSTMFTGYGIIILLITIIIKMILFPITYKTYLSSAKMRVLKPQVDAINKKHEGGDSMKKQQAVMALYKSTGVNPLAGCIPMLIQMPILFAMFRFFPASIELRQQSFLWANDLSSYDQIITWTTQIPLLSSFYGNHVSLFALLMGASSYLSMNANNAQMGGGNEMQAKQMKIMMKFMPIMLLFIFNSLPSGLNYYYFLANMMTFGQQWVIKRFFIDEEKILSKLESFKKSPKAKKGKSSFQKKLEDLAKQKGYNK